jgi:purine-binding chemotaxis protein CheW
MTTRVLVARLGEELIALAVGDVVSVLDAPAVKPLPLTPGGVAGQLLVRGTWLPVLDPRALLGIARGGTGPGAALVLRGARGEFAIWVDDAEDVREFTPEEVRPAPGRGAQSALLRGVVKSGDELIAWVEVTALIAAAEGILHTEAMR